MRASFSRFAFNRIVGCLVGDCPGGMGSIAPAGKVAPFVSDRRRLCRRTLSVPCMVFEHVCIIGRTLVSSGGSSPDTAGGTKDGQSTLVGRLFGVRGVVGLCRGRQCGRFLGGARFGVGSVRSGEHLGGVVSRLQRVSSRPVKRIVSHTRRLNVYGGSSDLSVFFSGDECLCSHIAGMEFGRFRGLFGCLRKHAPFSARRGVGNTRFSGILIILSGNG